MKVHRQQLTSQAAIAADGDGALVQVLPIDVVFFLDCTVMTAGTLDVTIEAQPNRTRNRGKTPREWRPRPLPSRGFRPYRDYDPEGFSRLGPKVISRSLRLRFGVAPESAEKP